MLGCGERYVISAPSRSSCPTGGCGVRTSCSSKAVSAGSLIPWKPTAFIRFTAARRDGDRSFSSRGSVDMGGHRRDGDASNRRR